ncbi:hypothetical protein Tco_0124452 [Tanacetum coccineum]
MLTSALLGDGEIVIPTLVVMYLSCLLEEQLLEPALNVTDHCCGREFRFLNCYDQKSFVVEERGLNCYPELVVFPAALVVVSLGALVEAGSFPDLLLLDP